MINTKQLATDVDTASAERFANSESMLLKMRVDSLEPYWSSDALEQFVSSTLSKAGATLDEILCPLAALVGKSNVPLSPSLSHFLKDIVVECFTRHRREYDAVQWPPFLDAVGKIPTQAQCYLALLAMPPDKMPFSLAETIVRRLKGTPFEGESAALLEDVRLASH